MARALARHPASWLALALLPCLGYLAMECYVLDGGLGMPLDDSFIHLQFARSLAAGDGLAYNPGERVTGSTAPLWTALLSLGFLLRLEPLVWAKALNVSCHLLAIAATWRLARALDLPRALAGFAAAVVATTRWLVWSSLAGMEISLFCALSLIAMSRHVEERRGEVELPLALPLFALATLLRPEALLLLLLAVGDRLLLLRRSDGELRPAAPPWRALLAGLALAALVVAPVALAYQILGGSPLPTTLATKGGYAPSGVPQPRFLLDVLALLVAAHPAIALLAPAGVLALLARTGERRDSGLLPAVWLLALPLAYGVLSGAGRSILGNFGRYLFPLLPVIAVLAAMALQPLTALPARLTIGRLAVHWRPAAAVLLLAPGLVSLAAGALFYARNVRNVEDGDVRLAKLLATVLPPAATLAVNDIGALKFMLPNRVIDLAGIATPAVHLDVRRSIAATGSHCPGVLAFVRRVRPDYLAVFPAWLPCFSHREFPPLLRVPVPDNITLGDDEILLQRTPWTRHPLRAASPLSATAPDR
jgi:hypothetical protein